ncbi:fructose PTS transporter subunit IIA [bacterium]|nr:fructose PTS transporter subunit IIA [bacterium]
MSLSDFMRKELVLLDLLSDKKEDVIKELISPIIKKGLANSENALHKAVLEREARGSTAIGNGVAIPHAETSSIKEKIIVFGRSKKGISFDAIDNEPVNLFFMIISPSREICPHLKTLARISRLLRNKAFRDALMNATSSEDIIKLIAMEEKPPAERSDMNKHIEQERRKYPRYAVGEAVELRLQKDSEKHLIVYYGYTKDISLGGICITLPKHKDTNDSRIKEDIKLKVRIPLLDVKKYLEINGQTVWRLQKKEDYNIGIQFISNDKETETALSRFIDEIKTSS